MAFKTYVTDSMYLAGRNKAPGTRWYDQVRPKTYDDVDAEAVVSDVVERAGLVIT